jgi:cyclopropane fatty-acyl-phospholipid synthase-like methyltransferase
MLRALGEGGSMSKPFAESCVQNRDPILAVLAPRLPASGSLLEIGSGTGQHAVYFAPRFPQLTWQTSDVRANHAGINAWIDEAGLDNVRRPLTLDVLRDDWPADRFDAVFSANTAHIMSSDAVQAMFEGVGRVLAADARFFLYGPFNYDGRYTAPSNARFDEWLRSRDPSMGVRDVAWLRRLGQQAGLELVEDVAMPADNRVLVWALKVTR